MTDLSQSQDATDDTVVSGNLFIDFQRHESALGESIDRLSKQFRGDELFSGRDPQIPLFDYVQDLLFPADYQTNYLISNTSLKKKVAHVAIRPRLTPQISAVLPSGMTLVLTGWLHDNKSNVDNPLFTPQSIVALADAPRRPFEREIAAFTFRQQDVIYPAKGRTNNLLTSAFIESLPPISVTTRQRLTKWFGYLQWKRKLIGAKLMGLRYLSVTVTPKGRYQFLVVAESKELFDRCQRIFRDDDLRAFPLGYSTNPWKFEYNEKHREGRDFGLSSYQGAAAATVPAAAAATMPWKQSYAAYVSFALDEEARSGYEQLLEAGKGEAFTAELLERVPREGFLALSAVGDLTLINRQEKELKNLERQAAYAPFLSSYLFDITAANLPLQNAKPPTIEVPATSLNAQQKEAVEKIVSVPDIGLIQGPPGTGKTTVIAEAVLRLVKRDKKILVASQANLAVDNVLDRLAELKEPSVRAIRLGRRANEINSSDGQRSEPRKPYTQQNAISTYYQAIAASCRRTHLDVWKANADEIKGLDVWLETGDTLADHVDRARQTLADREHDQAEASTTLAGANHAVAQVQEYAAQRDALLRFKGLLAGDGSWSGSLPEEVLNLCQQGLAHPLAALAPAGLRIARLATTLDHGTPAQRSDRVAGLLTEWHGVMRELAAMEGDLEWLRSLEGESVLSPAAQRRIDELTQLKQELLLALEADDTKVPEYRRVIKELRALQEAPGSGLGDERYRRLLTDAAHLALIGPDATRTKVMAQLGDAVAALRVTRAQVEQARPRLEAAIDDACAQLHHTGPEATELQRLDATLRAADAMLTEARQTLQDRLARLAAHVAKHGGVESAGDIGAAYVALHEQLASRQAELEEQAELIGPQQQMWGPLIKEWIADLEDETTSANDRTYFHATYAASCNIVGVTCTEARRTLDEAGHNRFDTAIIDEVSKATPVELVMSLMLARTAILVGDHRQLPPLFREREGSWEEAVVEHEERVAAGKEETASDPAAELNEANLRTYRDMVTSSLFKEHFEKAPTALKAKLLVQFRMHPQIMDLVNFFYEKTLTCGLADPDGKVPGSDPRGHRRHNLTLEGPSGTTYLTPERHALWIDSTTDPRNTIHYERMVRSSKANDLEAAQIARVVMDIELAYRQQGFGTQMEKKPVGIITFYGAQVRAIREALDRMQKAKSLVFKAIKLDVNTVDQYQGQERPIVLVSMVRNPRRRLSDKANTAQFERINVAFSRAQELLVIFGARRVFENYNVVLPHLDREGSENTPVYRYIIEQIEHRGGFQPCQSVLDAAQFQQFGHGH